LKGLGVSAQPEIQAALAAEGSGVAEYLLFKKL
jgi:hypothetical protein